MPKACARTWIASTRVNKSTAKQGAERSPATENHRGKGDETTTGGDVLSESAQASNRKLAAADASERSARNKRKPAHRRTLIPMDRPAAGASPTACKARPNVVRLKSYQVAGTNRNAR